MTNKYLILVFFGLVGFFVLLGGVLHGYEVIKEFEYIRDVQDPLGGAGQYIEVRDLEGNYYYFPCPEELERSQGEKVRIAFMYTVEKPEGEIKKIEFLK